ncbi:hypothetical protein [Kocuria sp.]|uniref:hypothetical protein n=1 Tax=Kocuria sp. TaxID=1871328 RepID=UPI0026E03E83|nr:hypothetical protein [Kocuria sp.]MDO5619286.1 hypothetical protein [Kocuria sp.]
MSEIVTSEAVDVAGYAWWKAADTGRDWDSLTLFQQHVVKEPILNAVQAAAPFIAEAVVLELLKHVKDPHDRETLERAAFSYHQEYQQQGKS